MDPSVLRFLSLAAVFAAVLIVVELVVGFVQRSRHTANVMNQRMELIARGLSREQIMSQLRRVSETSNLPGILGRIARKLETGLLGAGLKISAGTLLLYLVVATLALFTVACIFVFTSAIALTPARLLLLATFSVGLGFGIPFAVVSRIADQRRKKLEQQFPVALDVFVRGLRAGHPISAALELLTQEMQDPIGSEFGLVVDEVTYGADLRDALQNMADRCGLEDMHMFVVSLSVQTETGGNLAEILENLSMVIRERASLKMKVRALSSEGRMTALILTLLPVIAFTVLFLAKPSFFLDVADDPLFIPGFVALLLLYAVGFYAIRRMIDLKV
jgi:tight adherence protein B